MRLLYLCTLAISLIISANCFGQTVTNKPINYQDKENWAYYGIGENKPVDVFLICPTVDMGKEGNLNASLANEAYKAKFIGALNMERGIYEDSGRLFSPYYRQATFPIYSMSLVEQEKYLSIAYADIREAFKCYLENYNQDRPLILAGFSQGSDMVLRLLKEFYGEKKYQKKLVAAYCIGWRLTKAEKKAFPHLKLAKGEKDNGSIIMFNSEGPGIKESIIIPANTKTYAINPLNWKTSSKLATKKLNFGACFTDYDGNIKSEKPELTGAYLDNKRGSLIVTDIDSKDYPAHLVKEGIYHIYDYQFFYKNLKANVKTRTASYMRKNK